MYHQGHPMGRVDDVVIRIIGSAPPEIVGLDIGPTVIASRLHPRLGSWCAALERAAHLPPARPVRIQPGQVARVAGRVQLHLDESETAAGAVETRLRHFLGARVREPASRVTGKAQPLGIGEYHLSDLLSRLVCRDDGRPLGRLEEIYVDALPGPAQVTAFGIGAASLAERLGLGARLVFGLPASEGTTVRWNQLSISGLGPHVALRLHSSEI